MDYNDINLRLKRLYTSIEQQYEEDVLEHMYGRTETNENGRVTVILDFTAKHNEDETINRINSIISSLANLKDHLIKKLELSGGKGQDIENEINQSLALQLVLDLNNQEKHGYPLTKTKRSGKDPKIINISKALSSKPGVQATAFIRDPITGAGATNNAVIVIVGDVVDGENNLLFYLGSLIDKAIEDWEAVISKYNLN